MKKLLLCLGALSVITIASGCTSRPVMNLEKITVPVSKSKKDVGKAIKAAVVGKGWKVLEEKPGEVIADINVRKHYAKVKITYDKKTYSINYMESKGLNYNPDDQSIHRSYNRWVKYLQQKIDRQLAL